MNLKSELFLIIRTEWSIKRLLDIHLFNQPLQLQPKVSYDYQCASSNTYIRLYIGEGVSSVKTQNTLKGCIILPHTQKK